LNHCPKQAASSANETLFWPASKVSLNHSGQAATEKKSLRLHRIRKPHKTLSPDWLF
jgi:hypothetical protein